MCTVCRVTIRDKDVKVNIFDMAGHPIFYEVRNILHDFTFKSRKKGDNYDKVLVKKK